MGDTLQEIVSVQLLVVAAPRNKVLHFDNLNLHYVSYVEVLNPFRLIQKSKDVLHVCLVLRLKSLAFELTLVNGANEFGDLLKHRKLELRLLLKQPHLCVDLVHERKFGFKLHAVLRAAIFFVLLCALFLNQIRKHCDLTVDRRVSRLG